MSVSQAQKCEPVGSGQLGPVVIYFIFYILNLHLQFHPSFQKPLCPEILLSMFFCRRSLSSLIPGLLIPPPSPASCARSRPHLSSINTHSFLPSLPRLHPHPDWLLLAPRVPPHTSAVSPFSFTPAPMPDTFLSFFPLFAPHQLCPSPPPRSSASIHCENSRDTRE